MVLREGRNVAGVQLELVMKVRIVLVRLHNILREDALMQGGGNGTTIFRMSEVDNQIKLAKTHQRAIR